MAEALGPAVPALPFGLTGGCVRPILIHPHPGLRRLCETAGYLDVATQRALAADLFVTMYHAGGRGLAAPQLGVSRRVFVMDAGWKQGAPAPMLMLDPEILQSSDTRTTETEICLSIPDRAFSVSRPGDITAQWYDLHGVRHRKGLSGDEARIFQHECDHLSGRLVLDLV